MSVIPKLNESINISKIDSSYNTNRYIVSLGNDISHEVNELTYKLINSIDGKSDLDAITKNYNSSAGREFTSEEVNEFIEKVLKAKFIVIDETNKDAEISRQRQYLQLSLPILPAKLVNKISSVSKLLFIPKLAFFNLLLIIAFHIYYYTTAMSPEAINPDYIFSEKFFLIVGLTMLLTLFHEFGHASALKYNGQQPGKIGIGLYFTRLVFFTDVSMAWKLSRKKRMTVNLGGFYFESLSVIVCYLIYLATNELAFLLIGLFVDMKIAFGINPFFRFDGYWILSDLLGVTNLRQKASTLFVYYVRKMLFMEPEKPSFYDHLKPGILKLVSLYSLSSTIFFSYIGYLLITISISFLTNINQQIRPFINCINENNFFSEEFYSVLSILAGKIIITCFAVYFVYTFIVQQVRSIIKK